MNIEPSELLIVGAIVAIGLAVGLQSPSEDTVARWLTSYEAPADDMSRSTARRYLALTKRSRFGAAFVTIVVYSLATSRSDLPAWINTLVAGLAGYLIGAIAAEVAYRRPARGRFIGAMVAPRTLATYIPRIAIAALGIMPLAATALAARFWSVERKVPRRFHLQDPAVVMGAALFAIVVAVVTWAALRALVRRRQPTSSAVELALDDAMRASSAHALAGAALALEWLLLGFILSALQQWMSVDSSRFAGLVSFLCFLSLGAAFTSWAIIGHPERWRSRRPIWAENAG